MSIVYEEKSRFTSEQLELMANDLLGKASSKEKYPWLNDRQMRHRKYRETIFTEAIAEDPTNSYAICDNNVSIESIMKGAQLTKEEREFWLLSNEMNFNEIGELTRLHPKTINRRVKSAEEKLKTYILAEKIVPST